MPYHYDLFSQHSDDPSYQRGEAVRVLDANGQPIPDVIAYDQRSGRLDFFSQVNGNKEAVVKILPGLTVAFPDRKQAAGAVAAAEIDLHAGAGDLAVEPASHA